eukprot:191173_1
MTNLSLPIWQLFIDYDMMTPCRLPNALWIDKSVFNASVALLDGSSKSSLGTMIDSTNTISSLNYSVKDAIVILNIFSSSTTASFVSKHSIGSNQFNYTYPSQWKSNYGNKGNRFYFEGLFDFLDTETEYFLDSKSNMLYIWTPQCKNINTFKSIRGKTQTFALNITSSSYINITNVTFFATGFHIDKSSHIHIENTQFLYPSYSKRVLKTNTSNLVPIPSYLYGSNMIIRNCTFSSMDSPAFLYSGSHSVFENNLFEYTSYSTVSPYYTDPSNIAGSITATGGHDIFIQNTIQNYGPSNGYRCSLGSFIDLNLFINQSSLQHDGSQIQIAANSQNGTIISRTWSYNTDKYSFRCDGTLNGHQVGANTTIKNCVSFNDQSIMIKGDYHKVLNNIAWNHNSNEPDICIRYLYNDTNNHTLTMNNGADNFTMHNNDGCLYPFVGNASNNVEGPVIAQLNNVIQFDFRPKVGSVYDKNKIGPYNNHDMYYYIPGKQLNKPTFPIPRNNSVIDASSSTIDLIWRIGYKSIYHIGYLYDEKMNMIENKVFNNTIHENIWKIDGSKLNYKQCFWRIESVDQYRNCHQSDLWIFYIK